MRGGSVISRLASSYCSGSMPTPRSSISTARPRPTRAAYTSTGVGGLEKPTAFSMSSASTWITRPTARSASHTRSSTSIWIRR